MANSISLSTDMTTLYFEPSSGSGQSFSLAGNGVFITSIVDEVHVVAATSQLTNGTDECSIDAVAQWQAAFHENTTKLQMIGSDDTEATLTADIKPYDLTKGKVVNLRLDSTLSKILIRT